MDCGEDQVTAAAEVARRSRRDEESGNQELEVRVLRASDAPELEPTEFTENAEGLEPSAPKLRYLPSVAAWAAEDIRMARRTSPESDPLSHESPRWISMFGSRCGT